MCCCVVKGVWRGRVLVAQVHNLGLRLNLSEEFNACRVEVQGGKDIGNDTIEK